VRQEGRSAWAQYEQDVFIWNNYLQPLGNNRKIYACIRVCVCMRMCMCVYMYMYMCMCMYMYMCM